VNLEEEVRAAQEGLRLSSAQQAKMGKEINEYKIQIEANNRDSETFRMKIQKLMNENTALNDEVRNAQDNLRLSANQMAKLTNELKITCNENEELHRRLNEAMAEIKHCHELEEKVILLSAEVQRLRSVSNTSESENEGSKQKLMEYERK
jgi:prophage DNA circulation protein